LYGIYHWLSDKYLESEAVNIAVILKVKLTHKRELPIEYYTL
jgi:hypothetical protein